jgi:hypothetical protein
MTKARNEQRLKQRLKSLLWHAKPAASRLVCTVRRHSTQPTSVGFACGSGDFNRCCCGLNIAAA